MRGTDQAGSLGPDGVIRMVRDIRLTDLSLGEEKIFISDSTQGARKKLERSIAAKSALPAGSIIKEEDLMMLSPGDGFRWADRHQLVGAKLTADVAANEVIYPEVISK